MHESRGNGCDSHWAYSLPGPEEEHSVLRGRGWRCVVIGRIAFYRCHCMWLKTCKTIERRRIDKISSEEETQISEPPDDNNTTKRNVKPWQDTSNRRINDEMARGTIHSNDTEDMAKQSALKQWLHYTSHEDGDKEITIDVGQQDLFRIHNVDQTKKKSSTGSNNNDKIACSGHCNMVDQPYKYSTQWNRWPCTRRDKHRTQRCYRLRWTLATTQEAGPTNGKQTGI